MSFSTTALTILHVEDDPFLAGLVKASFKGLGFRRKDNHGRRGQ